MRRKHTNPMDRMLPERKTTSKKLKEKIRESVSSVLPITLLVLVLSLIFVPIQLSTMSLFLFGGVLLVAGMGLFTLGADTAMLPMGTHIGAMLTRKKNFWFLVGVAFAVAVIYMVPTLLMFLWGEEYLEEGITYSGGIKG